MTSDEIAHKVRELHGRPEDFVDGNLLERIMQYDSYELKEIPITDLFLGEWMVDDTMVEEMMQMDPDTIPPIVFDPQAGSIIDGIHRANARHNQGYTTIQAYVGVGEPWPLDEWEE